MREAVDGYVDAVAAALPEIQRDARVRIPDDRQEEYLLVMAIRRMWSSVNTQFWIMNDCIQIASNAAERIAPDTSMPIRGFRIGRDEISADSIPVRETRQLRKQLDELIGELSIRDLVQQASGPSDVAQRMFAVDQ